MERESIVKKEEKEGVNEKEKIESESKRTTLKKVKEEKEFVYYEGEIILSGSYYYYKNGLLKDKLCFYANEETGFLIPRDPNLYGSGIPDSRSPWFCFENQKDTNEMFNTGEILNKENNPDCIKGKATIKVDNYIVNRLEAAVYDTAVLKEIINLSRDAKCEL